MKKPTKTEVLRFRTAAGLSCREAAQIIGVGERTWQNYERGTRSMSAAAWELFNQKIKSKIK